MTWQRYEHLPHVDCFTTVLRGRRLPEDFRTPLAFGCCLLWYSVLCVLRVGLGTGGSLPYIVCCFITQLLPKCHPLGMFEEIGALTIAATPAELYSSVLKDTPLGMSRCMSVKAIVLTCR